MATHDPSFCACAGGMCGADCTCGCADGKACTCADCGGKNEPCCACCGGHDADLLHN
jgi:hypothetical protein